MKLFVPLERHEFDRLVELALHERRRPQDQAALLLAHALEASQQEPENHRHPVVETNR